MLKVLIALAALVLFAGFAAGFLYTTWKTSQFEASFPNIGSRTDIGGYALNSVDLPPGPTADLPPIVFIHGASGNLRDQFFAFKPPLEGRARLIFVDRPGYGYSDRGGPENDTPAGQADAIALLLDRKGIDRAIIVGHSLGGAIAASFGVRHPDRTIGLLFLSAATHPWNGGVDWYYDLAAMPVVGTIFRHAILLPVGLGRIQSGSRAVFAPNPMPDDYVAETLPGMILRPGAFYANARDVSGLNAFVRAMAGRYSEIRAPAVIITGDSDDIVAEEIHSVGLKRDIPKAELIWLHAVGHKTDYIANGLAVAAIEKLAGQPRDLQAMAAEFRPVKDRETVTMK